MSASPPLPFDTDDRRLEAEVLRRAAAVQGAYDELRDGEGRLRERWRRFFGWLPAGDPMLQLDRGVEQVAQQILADGVTHNVYSERGSAPRPWSLELLPLLIEPLEWQAIEQGVQQRAELLNAMLADLYGPQRLLHQGLLPPALLFRHPGYLRPLHGVRPAAGLHLQVVAFDLGRGPDGRWWVVSQRTQGPSGLGYVLHNRLITARMFPEAFREMRVQHIASSYRRLLDTVEALAREAPQGPGSTGQPRIVLLTPGPLNETYFEHAYLARYLGVPLVEGADLLVRDERLFLKTVEGLEPVHGVLRRLDDDYCDPLELKADSTLGVPALLQAVRAGTVVMANALGSGFLESPAVQGFLPAICEALLKAPLHLPSLATWWCGEQAAWDAVRDGLADKVIRHSFPRRGDQPALTDLQPATAWPARIDTDPEAWTVQARLALSEAPLWHDGRVRPTPAVLRVFAIADAQGRWHVLPGGMTRVAAGPAHSVSMQRGGSSLDTWVMTDGAVDTFSMLRQRLSVEDVAARRRPVSSRTADNLFWLGRYTERTEQALRLARATLNLIDTDIAAPPALREALSAWTAATGLVPPGVPSLARAPALFERALIVALADPGAGSVAFDLRALSNTAGALRDRLSPEHWGLVRRMGEEFERQLGAVGERATGDAGAAALPPPAQVIAALDQLAVQLAAVTGAQSDRMTRDHGWRLLTVGRLLERLIGLAGAFATLLRGQALASDAGVELLLDLYDSTITFRARYQRHHDLLALADLLVLDTANPRAWGGVLRRLRTEVRKLPGDAEALASLLATLPPEGAGLTLESLAGLDEAAIASRLAVLADRLADGAARLSDAIGSRYFAHADGGDRLQRV